MGTLLAFHHQHPLLQLLLFLFLYCCICWRVVLSASPCLPPGVKNHVTIDHKTWVCLVISGVDWNDGVGTEQYAQVVITPSADHYSRIEVSQSWVNTASTSTSTYPTPDPFLAKFGNEVAFHVESMGVTSYQKLYRNNTDIYDFARTFSLFTAIIYVDHGEVTGITFDDGCHFCKSKVCLDNTYNFNGTLSDDTGSDCYWTNEDCIAQEGDTAVSDICQLTLYVVWTGTDSAGNFFTSAQKRLSLFTYASLRSYVHQSKKGVSQL